MFEYYRVYLLILPTSALRYSTNIYLPIQHFESLTLSGRRGPSSVSLLKPSIQIQGLKVI